MPARTPTLLARLAVLLALVFASVGALRTVSRSGEALIDERGENGDDSELDALHRGDARTAHRGEGHPRTTGWNETAALAPHVARRPPPRPRWSRLRRVLAPRDDDHDGA
ncbi:MAG: hypothetical protein K1X88_10030 [Nannocystaceae bacterium]|nr:hypothetical protein [Nannocystaceae bacterium]